MSGIASGSRLERALTGAARAAGVVLTVAERRATPWASVTFSGARHTLTCRARQTQALDDWLERLGDLDLSLPGHVVADLSVDDLRVCDDEGRFEIAALTVER